MKKVKQVFQSLVQPLVDDFRQSTNLEYRLLKRGYFLFQHEVTKNGKTFELYVNDFIAENIYFICEDGRDLRYKTKVHSRAINIFRLRPDLIKKYFEQKCFDFEEYQQLTKEFDSSIIITETNNSETTEINIMTLEQKLSKVRAEILKYELEEKKPKHIGQRMFGYLLKEGYFNAYNNEQRFEEWQKFTELDSKPEMSYLTDPDSNKNNTPKINQQLKEIDDFFSLIDLKITVDYHKKKSQN